jgi:hypothetical protein
MNPFYSFLGFSNIKIGQTRAHSSLYAFRVGVNCILYYIYEKINIKYTVNYCLLLRVIFALLDPDPDSEYGSGSGSTDPIEYGSNTEPDPVPDPDPQPCKLSLLEIK